MQYQLADLRFDSDRPLPEIHMAVDGVAPEVHVRWHESAPLRQAEHFSVWHTPFGGVWLSFAAVREGFLLTFEQWGQFLVSGDAAHVDVFSAPGTPALSMRHLLLNQVMPLVLSRRGRLVVHASAVSWRDQVLAFVGRSGAGKSTMAAACATLGAHVVTDDCLVLRRSGDRWLAWPYDAGLRLWPDSLRQLGWPAVAGVPVAHFTEKKRLSLDLTPCLPEEAVQPLARMFSLPSAEGTRLSRREGLTLLASNVFRLDARDASESRVHFDALTDLVMTVPIDTAPAGDPLAAASAVLCRMDQP